MPHYLNVRLIERGGRERSLGKVARDKRNRYGSAIAQNYASSFWPGASFEVEYVEAFANDIVIANRENGEKLIFSV